MTYRSYNAICFARTNFKFGHIIRDNEVHGSSGPNKNVMKNTSHLILPSLTCRQSVNIDRGREGLTKKTTWTESVPKGPCTVSFYER